MKIKATPTGAHISLQGRPLLARPNDISFPPVSRTPRLRIWVLTDGKAGDELQCLGIAEELGGDIETRQVKPRAPWSWLAPYGPADPRESQEKPGSPIAPPYPDCVIASGRRAVPYLRQLRKLSPRTFTVFLKDPRTGAGTADLIWVPEHDRLRGDNVLTTITPPHRLTAEKLDAARQTGDLRLSRLASPRVAVLVGGKSRHHDFTNQDIEHFIAQLRLLIADGGHLMMTASRRTPPELVIAMRKLVDTHPGHFLWDGSGENPYLVMLALADFIVATADSFNMIGEATATGRPILVFEPSGGHRKLTAFTNALRDYGAVHLLTGRLEGTPYVPLDATRLIVRRIEQAMAEHRHRLRPTGPV